MFIGALIACIIFQMGLGHYFYTNSPLNVDPDLNEPISQNIIEKPLELPFDVTESWKSWVELNGLFRKAAKKQLNLSAAERTSLPMKKILYWNDPK